MSRTRLLNFPGQSRDSDGKFGSGGSGGGNEQFDDDPNVGEIDDGEYGFGRDPHGVSYTEFDVDEVTGAPKFSAAYRDEHGPLLMDNRLGKSGISVAISKKRGIHIADDSAGTENRQVVQEFTPKQARDLSQGIYDVYSGGQDSYSGAGVTVRPAGQNPTRDGVRVTWANGREMHLEGDAGDDEAFDLQENLNLDDNSIKARGDWRPRNSPRFFALLQQARERYHTEPDRPT